MKWCYKGTEPEALKTYREAHPTGTWSHFKDEAQEGYQKLQEQLLKDQRGLCAYCEIDLTAQDHNVEHFHPKHLSEKEGYNWHLDWQNLLATCKGGSIRRHFDERRKIDELQGRYLDPLPENKSCDQQRRNIDLTGMILHPLQIPMFPRLFRFRSEDGAILPDETNCLNAGISVEITNQTIEEFGLNCERLKRARNTVLDQLRKETDETGDQEYQDVSKDYLLPNPNGMLSRFFTAIRWFFAEDSETLLRESGFAG